MEVVVAVALLVSLSPKYSTSCRKSVGHTSHVRKAGTRFVALERKEEKKGKGRLGRVRSFYARVEAIIVAAVCTSFLTGDLCNNRVTYILCKGG